MRCRSSTAFLQYVHDLSLCTGSLYPPVKSGQVHVVQNHDTMAVQYCTMWNDVYFIQTCLSSGCFECKLLPSSYKHYVLLHTLQKKIKPSASFSFSVIFVIPVFVVVVFICFNNLCCISWVFSWMFHLWGGERGGGRGGEGDTFEMSPSLSCNLIACKMKQVQFSACHGEIYHYMLMAF